MLFVLGVFAYILVILWVCIFYVCISRFLLDRSDEVARELSGGGDARLLVRARRSLLLAAAELYSRTPQEKFV